MAATHPAPPLQRAARAIRRMHKTARIDNCTRTQRNLMRSNSHPNKDPLSTKLLISSKPSGLHHAHSPTPPNWNALIVRPISQHRTLDPACVDGSGCVASAAASAFHCTIQGRNQDEKMAATHPTAPWQKFCTSSHKNAQNSQTA